MNNEGVDGGAASSEGEAERWDFFVSCAQDDLGWAEWVAWHLEADGLRVLLDAWDGVSGSNSTVLRQLGLTRCDHIVALVSNAYLMSPLSQLEWSTALAEDPDGVRRKLVPIRVENCPRPGLLRGVVGFDLFGLTEEEALDRLRGKMRVVGSGRAKPTAPPLFPGGLISAQPTQTTSSGRPVQPRLRRTGLFGGLDGRVLSLVALPDHDRLAIGLSTGTILVCEPSRRPRRPGSRPLPGSPPLRRQPATSA